MNVLAIVNVWSLVSIRAGALILITIAALGSTLPSTEAGLVSSGKRALLYIDTALCC